MPDHASGSSARKAGSWVVAIVPQVTRLVALIDVRLVWCCMALIGVDLFFIAMHAGHTIYISLYNDRMPILGRRWHIGYDHSYSEIFGYLKMMIIAALWIDISGKWERPVYLAFAAIFICALLDDALEAHETLGQRIADAMALRPFAGLRPVDFGELMVWASFGVPLLAGTAVALVRSTARDRGNGLLLLGALAAVIMFAVVVDMAHVVVRNAFRGADLFFTVVEDGGEQITLSLACGLAILIRREIHINSGSARPHAVPVDPDV